MIKGGKVIINTNFQYVLLYKSDGIVPNGGLPTRNGGKNETVSDACFCVLGDELLYLLTYHLQATSSGS
jgi:hypothetical protein